MACDFRTTGLSLKEQIYTKLVIVKKSSSVYLAETGVLSWEFPSSSKLLYLNMASHFYKSKSLVPLLPSEVW